MTQPKDQSQAEAQTEAKPERSYRWGELPMQLHVRWLEPDEPGQPRQVMLAVTSYDDAPIARLLPEASLEDLMAQIQEMLGELEQSLSIRQVKWGQRQGKQTRKTPTRPKPQSTTTTPASEVSSTQIDLF